MGCKHLSHSPKGICLGCKEQHQPLTGYSEQELDGLEAAFWNETPVARMTMTTPPARPAMVTDAMIKAGDDILYQRKFVWWESMCPQEGTDLIRDIYLAMHQAAMNGDVVEALEEAKDLINTMGPRLAVTGGEVAGIAARADLVLGKITSLLGSRVGNDTKAE